MKWKVNSLGNEKIWYSSDVIEDIKEFVQKSIAKRPHSDNTILERILEIIERA